MHVHKDQVVITLREPLHGNGAVFCLIDGEVCVLEKADSDLAVEFIVFDKENVRPADGRKIDFWRGDLGFALSVTNVGEDLDDGVKEHRGRDGLDQNILEGSLLCLAKNFFAAVSGDHNKMGRA